MSRYIERRKAIDRIREGLLKKMFEDKTENCFEYARLNIWAREWLNELPSIDINQGKWIEVVQAPNDLWYGTCSVCGERQTIEVANYCPCCGAKMYEDDMPSVGWIPCMERLPDHDGEYLVSYRDLTVMKCDIAYWSQEAFPDGEGEWSSENVGSGVVAWMELPEPYKEKKDE